MSNHFVDVSMLDFKSEEGRFYCGDTLFSGVCVYEQNGNVKRVFQVCEGLMWGMAREYDSKPGMVSIASFEDVKHGYAIEYFPFGEVFSVHVEGEAIEVVKSVKGSRVFEEFRQSNEQIEMLKNRQRDFHVDKCESSNFVKFYLEQEKLRENVITSDCIEQVRFVAGADVAYNELEQRMVGALVVLDAHTLEVVDQAIHEMDITFPYVPGLFSFREVPPLVAAYHKLKIKPNLIVCDGHGVAHPKGAGMASHLGIELDVPTIGCAKSRLIGGYDEVGDKRGSFSALRLGEKEIGRVLRTQDNIKPMFVSVGHKVSLDTACEWVLRLCPEYRQPETTRRADALVRTAMKERTDVGYPEE
jgi:deoxyribonuclease V